MRKFKGAVAAEATGGNEKLKIAVMLVGLGLVVTAWFMTLQQGDSETGDDGLAPVGGGQVAIPAVPPGTYAAFADATEEDRVLLERDPLEVLLAHARQLTTTHLEAMEVATLDRDAYEALTPEATDQRGRFFSSRGEVVALREPATGNGSERFVASLELEGGEIVHAVVPRLADPELGVGDWARIDGAFVKRYLEEIDGTWREGPLFVGPRLMRSFADFGEVTAIPAEVWAGVEDDALNRTVPEPEELRWRALAWMRDMPDEAIDWESARTLDAATMEAILTNPDANRGQPFRLPVGLTLHLTNKRAGENPARLASYTEGWLYNTNWSERSPVMVFLAPGDQTQDLGRGVRIGGDFVFLRNQAYATNQNVRRVAPVFAAARFEAFEAPPATALWQVATGFVGLAVLLTLLIVVLWRRDQARSKALQEKLIERRRARRARPAGSGV